MVRLPRNEKQTHRLNSRPQMWPLGLTLAMTLTLNFQGQIWNLLYLSQKWCDCHETKANISIDLKASNVTIGFDFGHDLDLEFSRSYMEIPISLPKMAWFPRNEKQTYRLNCRPQIWPMGLTLAMTLTFEFSRSNVIFTIWWPRSGVRIDQIVTGVTSDVGVPSTCLVWSLMSKDNL